MADGRTDLGVVLDGLVETMVVRVDDLVNDVLDEVALLLEELDLAIAVLRGEDVHDVRQRVEPRRCPSLVDPRQPFLQVLHARTPGQTPNSNSIQIPGGIEGCIRNGTGLTDLSAGIGRPSKMPRRWRFIVTDGEAGPGERREIWREWAIRGLREGV